ncbi:STAS domain-containing protein [Catelliglobosispora koreensis]|uniref:STAS domain-containing protein n=1 Tax=Catelliglobosispora koreensis TaxID=129052 RepID=UPI00037EA5C0|nr:STAS domain-containing protein [Catelliglobosispora koreensis]
MNAAHIDIQGNGAGKVVVSVSGEIDLAVHDLLTEKIDSAVKMTTEGPVVIDLSKTTFLDSSGIRVLIEGLEAARHRELSYHVTGVTGIVHRVMEVTGVLEVLTGES